MKRRPEPIICGFCKRSTDILIASEPGTFIVRCLACGRTRAVAREKWRGPAIEARSL